jgi:hypothetical protein
MGHTTTQLIARYAQQTGTDLQKHYTSPVDGILCELPTGFLPGITVEKTMNGVG